LRQRSGQEHPEALQQVELLLVRFPVVPAACRQRVVPERSVRLELVHLVARVRRVDRQPVVPAPDSSARRRRAVGPDPAVAAVDQAAAVAAVVRMHSTR
jgi:hypothetical protein